MGHSRTFTLVLTLAMLATLAVEQAPGSEPEGAPSPLGRKIDDFTLASQWGREWSLKDFSDKQAVVIVYLGTECPLAKLYGPRLEQLQKQYAERGVAFLGINSNTQDSMTELAAYAERCGVTFPMLKDVGNRVADAMGAQRTPEVFVLDQQHVVRYHGRIDDQYGVGFVREAATRHDLAAALDALLEGKPISVPETEPVGCYIGRAKQVDPTGGITYSNQIARIFNKRCVECHREGEIAPFSLASYQDIVGWEDTILEVIAERRMPPWFANPEHGAFANDARLTDEERQQIETWIANGVPEGDPAQLPEPPSFAPGWRIDRPDEVIYMAEKPFEVPAEGVVDYQHFLVDPGWTEDRYVYMAEARPGNTAVVHHILVYILPPGSDRNSLRTVLVGYAPGSTPIRLSDGLAIHVPANSKFLFQLHYTPNGTAQTDRSYAGVRFIDKEQVKKLKRGRLAVNDEFRIPPHAANHVVTASYTSSVDELLLNLTPHMHLRGKSFRYEATYPDGTSEILLDIPRYDFNWQLKYILREPKLLPKGTKILCTATYDNSEDNLVNPDPSREVKWGDQSWEEMMIGFFDVVRADESDDQPKSTNVSVDPSGHWKWRRMQGLKMIEESLTLTLKDNIVAGKLHTVDADVPIQAARMDGDRLTFQVELPRWNGLLVQFDATVKPEKIVGKATFTVATVGRSQTYPWLAERSDRADDEASD